MAQGNGSGSRKPTLVLPPFLVISAPDGAHLTPDDLVIEAARNDDDIQRIWDVHDGRSYGTMVVGVYRLSREGNGALGPDQPTYVRDTRFGILGDEGRRRRADPDSEADHL